MLSSAVGADRPTRPAAAARREGPTPCTLPELFAEQVARHPDTPAVEQDGSALTYRELDARAGRLATALVARGVGPDVPVVVSMARSTELVIAFLAVTRAGGAYVPLDPAHPLTRRRYVLDDIAPQVVLVDRSGALPDALTPTELLGADAPPVLDPPPALDTAHQDRLHHAHTCYVIYTSGSTGTPKPVVVAHTGLSRLAARHRDYVPAHGGHRVLLMASIGFDGSVWEMTMALLSGGTVVVSGPEAFLAGHAVATRATHVGVTPSLLAALPPDGLPPGATVITASEAASRDLVDRWAARHRLVNSYGPTETTVFATGGELTPGAPVTIGGPVPATGLQVLDATLTPVGTGVPGELYVSGAGLARGYRDRPGLTASRFVADPSGPPGSRAYRTGDLVRWTESGDLEFLGRTDDQIGLRGVRLEPGEVEAALRAVPGVARAAVVARTDARGEQRLVAYLVPDDTAADAAPGTAGRDQQLDEWQATNDAHYRDVELAELGQVFTGWRSAYTGAELPAEQMREWCAATAARVLESAPARVLEVGVGIGLVLARVAPHVAEYWGTDLSGVAVARLQAQVDAVDELAGRVHLRAAAAHQLAELPRGHFDTVILNSVAQYFPDRAYLLAFLDTALELLAPGGRIYLGDLRHLGLAPVLQTAIVLGRHAGGGGSGDAPAAVLATVGRRVREEEELLVDPELFHRLAVHDPRIGAVDVAVRRGTHHNEMTRHRYDVVLRRSPSPAGSTAPADAVDPVEMTWGRDVDDLDTLTDALVVARAAGPAPVRVRAVPNGRLRGELAAYAALHGGADPATAAAALALPPTATEPDPEQLHDLAARLGLGLHLTWSAPRDGHPSGALDATFHAPTHDPIPTPIPAPVPPLTAPVPAPAGTDPWRGLTNVPLRGLTGAALVAAARSAAAATLPAALVPAAYVVVDDLPRTASGKLDRTALPDVDLGAQAGGAAPRTPAEQVLCGVFAALLGLPAVGVHDDFFALGGHSLLAARLVNRVRAVTGAALDVRDVFAAPTPALLASHTAAGRPAVRPVPVALAARPPRIPLSPAQRRLWFADQVEGPSRTFTVPLIARLDGVTDPDATAAALAAALSDVVARHEPLRTVFPLVDGDPEQHVLPAAPVELVRRTGAPEELDALVDAEAAHLFDLAARPPLHAALVTPQEPDGTATLVLVVHHIAQDGWSVRPLLADLAAAHAARRTGAAPDLVPLPLQYVDYTLWLLALLDSPSGDGPSPTEQQRQLSFWRRTLAGLDDELALPGARPRPARPTHRGGAVDVVLDAAVHERLHALARAHDATVFMVVQAALAATLTRLGAGEDLALGTAVAGRGDEALDELVGCFVNTVVLRTDTSGDPTFAALLDRVRRADLAAFAHADVPFDAVVADLAPVRVLGRHPLFQVALSTGRRSGPTLALAGLQVETAPETAPAARFDLEVDVDERTGVDGRRAGIDLRVVHDLDRLDGATAATLTARLVAVLDQVLADPQRRIGRLDLLADGERAALLAAGTGAAIAAGTGNGAATGTGTVLDTTTSTAIDTAAPGATLTELFARRVAAAPHALALDDGTTALTYAELAARADAFAAELARRGVGREDVVAVLAERSTDLVVALLGIVTAGAAYLPLPLNTPTDRLAAVAAAATAPLLICDAAHAAHPFVAASERPVLRLDEPLAAAPGAGRPVVHPDQLAYVMHTSGSTGFPKAIAITHRGVVDLAADPVWEVTAADRVLFQAPHAFDGSTYEIWAPLLAGGCVVVAPPQVSLAGHAGLAAVVAAHRVSRVSLTAGLFRVIAEQDPAAFAGLAEITTGGDVIDPGAVRAVLAACPTTVVRPTYGPTEITLCATHTRWSAGADIGEVVPLGGPMSGTRAVVLDRFLAPVPVGVLGELYLAGPGVARGYAGAPAATAARFVADPFGAPGGRLYRTGDLAAWAAHGPDQLTLTFHGRSDQQVKVRGFRVEPAEVEAAIVAQPGVTQAAVGTRVGGDGERALIAHYTGDADPAVLRAALATRLPAHLVPAHVVPVATWPLTANGKLDRARLPAPTLAAGRAPRPGREEVLCAAFAAVLGVDAVGPDDDFFAIGGSSLSATRLVHRIIAATGAELGVATVFAAPTPARLAARLAAAPTRAPLVAVRPRPVDVPLSPAQRRLWFLHRLEGPSATWNIPVITRLRGEIDVDALGLALVDVAERHEALRTTFTDGRPTDGTPTDGPWQRVGPADAVGLGVSRVAAADVDDLITAHCAHPFDLTVEPPLHAHLLQVDPSNAEDPAESVLVLVVHHIAGDGWSMGVLTQDLGAAYAARRRGSAPDWAPLGVQYADHALAQAAAAEDATGQDFWRAALAGLPVELDLPRDRPRPDEPAPDGAAVHAAVPAATLAGLRGLARTHQATLLMVVQAALATLLTRSGAGTDVPLGTVVSGRDDPALDGVVGFFVNSVVLRTDTSGDPSFAALLDRVRRADLAAFDHQHVGFDRVVETLAPPRRLGRHPLFQVAFGVEDAPPGLVLDGVAAAPAPAPLHPAKFDLLFGAVTGSDGEGAPSMALTLTYATAMFDAPTATGLLARLVRLLGAVVADPDRPIGLLALLDADEQRRLLVDWGTGPDPDTAPATLDALFTAQVDARPHAPAVDADGVATSYADLDAAANRLARLLIGRGVGPDVAVAVALPRTLDWVVAVLAVAKAGGVYVPVDPAHPPARRAFVVADSGAVLLLTDHTGAPDHSADPAAVRPADHSADQHDVPVLLVDGPEIAAAVAVASERPVTDADRLAPLDHRHLCYVVYTSGSTGTPKGVGVAHTGLVRLLARHRQFVPGTDHRVLATASIGFDGSVWELVMALLLGGTLVPAEPRDLLTATPDTVPPAVASVTHVLVTPSLLAALPDHAVPAGAVLITASEACPQALLDRWAATHPVQNSFGPTETTVCATGGSLTAGEPVTIGVPVPGSAVRLLDDALAPVPVGVTGELYLTGSGLARGYPGRAGLTASRFVADPWGRPGERMYRCGDLARWDGAGRLVFCGRRDDQVKVRGVRVELGEVEAALLAVPGVTAAAAVLRADADTGPRLVGYLTGPADPATVRAAVAARLPEHLVPAALVMLDALPRTTNGKLDRAALPAPESADPTAGPPARRSPRLQLLCSIYAELLGRADVDAHLGFFAAGGHSLLATRLVNRVRAALGIDLALRDVFAHPTPAGLLAHLDGLDASARRGAALTAVAVRPDPLPVSAGQRSLWLLDRLDPAAAAAYTIALVAPITGALDVAALRGAVADLMGRHEALRTVLSERDGAPVAVVRPAPTAADAPVQVVTGPRDPARPDPARPDPARPDPARPDPAVPDPAVSDDKWSDDELPDGADRALAAVAEHPFDLADEMPLRVAVLDDHFVLLVHHSAADGWSMGLLARDLATAYAARTTGAAPDWAPLPVQPVDHTLWQTARLAASAGQLDFWRTTLAGLPDELTLPADRPRPPRPTHRGGEVTVRLDPTDTAAVHRLARRHDVTLLMVLQAALAVTLNRLGAGPDVPLGTVVAGRDDEALDDVVGFFVGTVVLRTDTAGDPPFAALLGRVRTADLAAFARAEIPFDAVVDAVAPRRVAGRHPLFQVMVSVAEPPGGPLLPDVTAAPVRPAVRRAKFDLDLTAEPDGDAVVLRLGYAVDLFDAATAAALLSRVAAVLRQAAADPTRPVSGFDLLDPDERVRLRAWGRGDGCAALESVPRSSPDAGLGSGPDAGHDSVPAAFAAMVAAHPDTEAVRDQAVSLTYPELAARAAHLAAALRAAGVGPDTVVPVLASRSAELVVALLGIVTAGGAYLPLPPDAPPARLAELTASAGSSVLVVDAAHTGHPLATGHGAPLVIDPAADPLPARPGPGPGAPAAPVHPDQLAYVMHTSGSTGRPKAVAITHRGVLDLARDPAWEVAAGDRVLFQAPHAFDGSTYEIWAPLLAGGTVVIAPPGVALADALPDLIATHRLDRVSLTAGLFRVLAEHEPGVFARLAEVTTGGDVVPAAAVRAVLDACPSTVVRTTYGPTEITMCATHTGYRAGDAVPAPVPLGAPMTGTRMCVLDAALAPTPVGVIGELYLAGPGLARGYAGDPALTAARFVADPDGPPGARMYRTGDLARWDRDGTLSFHGRRDHQVKIRGFRVEPGEIEAALAALPEVTQAAVGVHRVAGEPELVAHFTGTADPAAVRSALAGRLPAHLVPRHLLAVSSWPLTANGKLDRDRLPVPAAAGSGRVAGTDRERRVCAVIAEVLGVPQVGPDDDVFALGANSLLVVALARRIGAELGRPLPAQDVFAHPTAAALAARADVPAPRRPALVRRTGVGVDR